MILSAYRNALKIDGKSLDGLIVDNECTSCQVLMDGVLFWSAFRVPLLPGPTYFAREDHSAKL